MARFIRMLQKTLLPQADSTQVQDSPTTWRASTLGRLYLMNFTRDSDGFLSMIT